MEYRHVDVFSKQPFSGNSLTVFITGEELSSNTMQKIAAEMRHFESIFLQPTESSHIFKARIYTIEEELDFAGHPIIGACCVLHEKFKPTDSNAEWTLVLNNRTVQVISKRCSSWYEATMEQGIPIFHSPLDSSQSFPFLKSLNLLPDDCVEKLPLQVVSTGLPYLLVPIKLGIEKTHITCRDFETQLRTIGAKFVYVFDVNINEGRTWDNNGKVEDVATGSAAGPLGAYLVKHHYASLGELIFINQGKFMNRPSQIKVKVIGSEEQITSVQVSGDVCMVAYGILENF